MRVAKSLPSGVRAYAGYFTATGELMCFSVMVNNKFTRTDAASGS
jgi:hypothetical protein